MQWVDLFAILVPVVALGVSLHLTRRLETDDPTPAVPEYDGSSMAVVWWVVGSLLAIPLVFFAMLKAPRIGFALGAAGVLVGVGIYVRRLSLARRAAREIVAGSVGGLGLIAAFVLARMNAYPWTWLVYGSLAAAVVLALVGLILPARAQGMRRLILPLLLVAYMIYPVFFRASPPPCEEDAVSFVTNFDEPVLPSRDWERFGFVAHWLRARGVDFDASKAAQRIRNKIAAGEHIFPRTLRSALAAGLLRRADLAPFTTHPSLERVYADAKKAIVQRSSIQSFADDVCLLLALDDVDDPKAVSAWIDAHWPKDNAPRALEEVHAAARMFVALGAQSRLDRRAPDIQRLLSALWTEQVDGGGFARAIGDEDVDGTACVMALELMRYVGVPDAIDMDKLRVLLRDKSTRSYIQNSFESYKALYALADLDLQARDADSGPIAVFVARHGDILAILCVILFGTIVLLRAPSAVITLESSEDDDDDLSDSGTPPKSFEADPEPAHAGSQFHSLLRVETEPTQPADPS